MKQSLLDRNSQKTAAFGGEERGRFNSLAKFSDGENYESKFNSQFQLHINSNVVYSETSEGPELDRSLRQSGKINQDSYPNKDSFAVNIQSIHFNQSVKKDGDRT